MKRQEIKDEIRSIIHETVMDINPLTEDEAANQILLLFDEQIKELKELAINGRPISEHKSDMAEWYNQRKQALKK